MWKVKVYLKVGAADSASAACPRPNQIIENG